MSARFTDDEIGKNVVNANGEEIGIVSAVEHGTAHVDPDPGITDSIKAALGWEGRDEETYPLQEEAIDRITDDEIRLQGDLSSGGTTGTSGTADRGVSGGGVTDRDDTTGMGRDSDDLDDTGTDDLGDDDRRL